MTGSRARTAGDEGTARARAAGDEGAAVAEFVLISGLLLLLVVGVVQLALVLHTRNVLSADAAEGARHGANLGVPEASGGPYAEALLQRSVPVAARGIACNGRAETGNGGVPEVAVTCAGSMRLVLVPLGPRLDLSVTGRAVKETA